MGPQGEVGQQGLMGLLGLTGPVGPQGLVGQELVSLSNLPAGEYLVLARLNSFNAFRTGAGATMGCFVTAQVTLYQVPCCGCTFSQTLTRMRPALSSCTGGLLCRCCCSPA